MSSKYLEGDVDSDDSLGDKEMADLLSTSKKRKKAHHKGVRAPSYSLNMVAGKATGLLFSGSDTRLELKYLAQDKHNTTA